MMNFQKMEVEAFKKYNDAFLSTNNINVRIRKIGLRFLFSFKELE